jgi:uncharacterized membrane protein YphA (DoxX/SURF4 family)
MNFRNKKLIAAVRIIFGLFILMSGVTGWMSLLNNMQGIPEPMIPFMRQLASMNLIQLIKTTEVVTGIMLIFGIYPALAAVVLAPLCIGVLVFNATVAPAYIATGIFITILDIYLGYAYWDKYKAIF